MLPVGPERLPFLTAAIYITCKAARKQESSIKNIPRNPPESLDGKKEAPAQDFKHGFCRERTYIFSDEHPDACTRAAIGASFLDRMRSDWRRSLTHKVPEGHT